MCLKNQIQQTLAEIAEKQERLAKLEKLESATAPVKNLLMDLLADYSQQAPEELPNFWEEILTIGQQHGLSVQPLALDELRQWKADCAALEQLRSELAKYQQTFETHTQDIVPELHDAQEKREAVDSVHHYLNPTPEAEDEARVTGFLQVGDTFSSAPVEYEPDEAYDTVESILKSNGFSQHDTDMPPDWDASELYENYREWDIFYSVPNGGIVAIGLNNSKSNQFWDASTEYIQEIEGNTFPESLGDYDEIVTWTKQLIDRVVAVTPVESFEVPGQLALEFPEPEPEVLTGDEYDAAVEEELGCNWEDDDPTELQKLLAGNSNFTFEDLGVSVAVESVFTEEEETEEENEEDSGEPGIVEVEEARFTVSNAEGKTKEYYHDAELLVRGSQRLATIVKFNAEQYAKEFLQDLEKDEEIKEKIARWNADETLQSNQKLSQSAEPEPTKETKVETVQPEATIDNFLDFPINTMGVQVQVYPQYAGENNLMGVTFRFLSLEEKSADRKPKVVYSTSLLAVELGDRSYKLAAIDLLQNWQAKETARLEKLANPYAKEEDKFVEMVKISNDVGYLKEKATGKILAGYAAFSNKKTDGSRTGHAKKRAQKWADLLKGSFQIECQPPRIPKRMVSDNVQQSFAYEVKIVNPSIGQLIKLAEEDLSLLPLEREEKQAPSELAHSELPHDNRNGETIATEKVTDKKSLTDNEVKIVELIRAALSKFNAEAVQEINSAEVSELVRNKVWELLTEEEQKVYELLLKMEFAQAPDFSVKTPEFITRVDGKQGKSVFLSLRAIDGVSSRVWRYQGQTGEGGYPCKEAATVAAWLL